MSDRFIERISPVGTFSGTVSVVPTPGVPIIVTIPPGTTMPVTVVVPSALEGSVISNPKTEVITRNTSFGNSVYRDIVTTTGAASVANSNSLQVVSMGAVAGQSLTMRSVEYARIVPGLVSNFSAFVTRPIAPITKQTWTVGLYEISVVPSVNDGFYWVEDADIVGNIAVVHVFNGSSTVVPQASWNVDQCNGLGPSGALISFDAALTNHGVTFGITFDTPRNLVEYWISWVNSTAAINTANYIAAQRIVVHRIPWAAIAIQSLPIYCYADNGSGPNAWEVSFGNREYSIFGPTSQTKRTTSLFRNNQTTGGTPLVGASNNPLITFRRKLASPRSRLKVRKVTIAADNATSFTPGFPLSGYFMVVLNPSIDGAATFTNPYLIPAIETTLEVSYDATILAWPTGTMLYYGDFGTTGSFDIPEDAIPDIPFSMVVCLFAWFTGSQANATCSMLVEEDW